MYFLTNSFGMKDRETSRCAPRHWKRGMSSISTAGTVHETPATGAWRKTSGGMSCRSVCAA